MGEEVADYFGTRDGRVMAVMQPYIPVPLGFSKSIGADVDVESARALWGAKQGLRLCTCEDMRCASLLIMHVLPPESVGIRVFVHSLRRSTSSTASFVSLSDTGDMDSCDREQDRDTRGVYGGGSGNCEACYGLDDAQPESEKARAGVAQAGQLLVEGSGVEDLIHHRLQRQELPPAAQYAAQPGGTCAGSTGTWQGCDEGWGWALHVPRQELPVKAPSGMGAAADKEQERERDGPSATLLDKVRALDALLRVGALWTLDLKGNDLRVLKRNQTLKVLNLALDVAYLVSLGGNGRYTIHKIGQDTKLDVKSSSCVDHINPIPGDANFGFRAEINSLGVSRTKPQLLPQLGSSWGQVGVKVGAQVVGMANRGSRRPGGYHEG
ncbi:hypothetical protein DFH07DRAFT_778946 [Mycena maculata]|uniref:Uncharacterized protein n=1 Tax=Mycena maculata TaxID=230809 RepID=A0AAD7IBS0_9AGAR|nr:hypothetical protein DFH07DRAFT_778946 [Mycena maculata]